MNSILLLPSYNLIWNERDGITLYTSHKTFCHCTVKILLGAVPIVEYWILLSNWISKLSHNGAITGLVETNDDGPFAKSL